MNPICKPCQNAGRTDFAHWPSHRGVPICKEIIAKNAHKERVRTGTSKRCDWCLFLYLNDGTKSYVSWTSHLFTQRRGTRCPSFISRTEFEQPVIDARYAELVEHEKALAAYEATKSVKPVKSDVNSYKHNISEFPALGTPRPVIVSSVYKREIAKPVKPVLNQPSLQSIFGPICIAGFRDWEMDENDKRNARAISKLEAEYDF